MSIRQEIARVVRTQKLSPSVQWVTLELQHGPLAFEPGQWINLHVPLEGGACRRAYSLAAKPGPQLELAVTQVSGGRASPWLCRAKVGALLQADGPHGFFCQNFASRASPNLWVATGTGLSPFRSMAQSGERSDQPTVVLFGCRTEADILWREEWERWAESAPGRRFEVTLSRPATSWQGRTGYVQRHLVELARELGAPHVFVCGLSPMVSAVRALCKTELGLARQQIHSERYD